MRYFEIISENLNVALTAKNFGAQLRNRLENDRSAKNLLKFTDEQIITYFSQFDPTKAKKYLLNWILPRYLRGGINHVEDLEGISQDLAEFDRWKHKMPIKDIVQIKSASDLSVMIRSILHPEGSVEQDGVIIPPEIVKAAYAQSIIIYETDDIIAVIPTTQLAAGFWGRNSEWCTAYGFEYGRYPTRTSFFSNYDGPGHRLLIFFDKKNEERDVQCYYGDSPDDTAIMNVDDSDCSGSRNLQLFINSIPKDKLRVIKDNCLNNYDFDDRGRYCMKFKNVADLIDEYGDDSMKWAAKIVIDGDYIDYNSESNSIEDILNNIPSEVSKKLDRYVEEKYPDYEDEYSDLAEFIENSDEDDIEELKQALENADRNAQERGAEREMYEYFNSALKEAGVEYEYLESPCSLVKEIGLQEILVDPSLVSEEETKIELDQPHYGFSGYDESTFDESDELMSILDNVSKEQEAQAA